MSTDPGGRRLKVLHLIGSLDYGGAELLLIRLATLIRQSGHRVEILVLGHCRPELLAELDDAGITVYYRRGGYGYAGSWRLLRQLADGGGFDVVHAHLFPALYLAALARGAARRGTKWVYTEHSTTNRRRSSRLFRSLERGIYSRFDEIVCVSVAVADSLRAWLGDGPPLRVVHNGIDVQAYAASPAASRVEYDLPAGAVIVLALGRLRPEKNQVKLVEALPHLPADYHLLLAGDGPERAALERRIRDLGVTHRVHLLGAVGEVAPLLKMADALALVSLFEGFGLSALEAVAAGIPLVYSDTPELREIFAAYGVATCAEDAAAIAACIVHAVTSGVSSEETRRSRRAILERYKLEHTVNGYLDVYAG